MLSKLRKSKAQTTAEYAILIALVVGAAMAMQLYVKRGLQGRVHDAVNHTGAGGDVGGEDLVFSGDPFEPGLVTSQAATNQSTSDTENVRAGGVTDRNVTTGTTATRTQTILPE